jgi:hypothetical protein
MSTCVGAFLIMGQFVCRGRSADYECVHVCYDECMYVCYYEYVCRLVESDADMIHTCIIYHVNRAEKERVYICTL